MTKQKIDKFPRLNDYTGCASHERLVEYTEELIEWAGTAEDALGLWKQHMGFRWQLTHIKCGFWRWLGKHSPKLFAILDCETKDQNKV
jgi:hypothetical protein